MRKMFSVALMATLACAFGLAQNANAGVTIDVVFQDATVPSGITVLPGDMAAPGCTFTGYYKDTASGRCMDVILTTTDLILGVGTSVTYDSDDGLVLAGLYEWKGYGVEFGKAGVLKSCAPPGGLADNSGVIQSFDCIIAPPSGPPEMPVGTYRIGTIIWDTSGVTPGQETIAAYIDMLVDGAIAFIDGNVVDISTCWVWASSA